VVWLFWGYDVFGGSLKFEALGVANARQAF